MSLNLASVLAHHAARFPERPCLVWRNEVISYGTLYERVARLAAGLHYLGVGKGDVVGVLLYNCPAFIELLFATSWVGAIFMPLNWRLAAAELTYIVNHAGARLLVSELDLLPRVDRPKGWCAGRSTTLVRSTSRQRLCCMLAVRSRYSARSRSRR